MDSARSIRTEEDCEAALSRIWEVFHADLGSPEGDELDRLVRLVSRYEDERHPIGPPTPIDEIESRMDQDELAERDLISIMGGKQKVSDDESR